MKMTNVLARLLLTGAAAVPVFMLGTAEASAQYTTTIQLGSSTPNTGASAVQGDTVVVKSKTVQSDGEPVTAGIVMVSYRVNAGVHLSCSEGLPFYAHLVEQNVTNPANGTNEVQYSYSASTLGAFSFRGSYFLGGTFPSSSPCVDLTVVAANGDDPCVGLDPVVHIYATGAFPDKNRMEAVPLQKNVGVGLDIHTRNFLDCIKNNSPQKLNAGIDIGRDVALVAQMGNIAYRTGEKVFWNNAKQQFTTATANALITPEYHNEYRLPKY